MDGDFELPESPPGDGGGVSSDESTTAGAGKNNQDIVTSSEVSSPFPVVVYEGNLELGLGLSIGCGDGGSCSARNGGGGGGQHGRILTAKDFSLSLSSFKNSDLFNFGSSSSSSVVGWPPIRRGQRLANQTKSPVEQSSSTPEPNTDLKNDKCLDAKEVVFKKGYRPVKVNMDGSRIGRKVDLNVHDSYETLARTVEDMFSEKRSSPEAGRSKLLDATSEFVLAYEDKDGDCMLLGDVPWQMFLNLVKRLRIVRNSESNKLDHRKRAMSSSSCQEKKTRRCTDGV